MLRSAHHERSSARQDSTIGGMCGHRRGLAGLLNDDQDVVIRVPEVGDKKVSGGCSLATEELFVPVIKDSSSWPETSLGSGP